MKDKKYLQKGCSLYSDLVRWCSSNYDLVREKFYKKYPLERWIFFEEFSEFSVIKVNFYINQFLCFDKKENVLFIFHLGSLNPETKDSGWESFPEVLKIAFHLKSFRSELALHIKLLSNNVKMLQTLKVINKKTKYVIVGHCTHAVLSTSFINQYSNSFFNLKNVIVSLLAPPKILMKRDWMESLTKLPINLVIFNIKKDKWASDCFKDKTYYLDQFCKQSTLPWIKRCFVGQHDFVSYVTAINKLFSEI